MIQEPMRYEDLIQVVSKWSPKLKLDLIQELLKSLEPTISAIPAKEANQSAPTLSLALGLLSSDDEAPTDAKVE